MQRRNTIQKEMVLDAVRSLRDHATAEEVYTYILRRHPSISKGTVYRNLNLLSDNGDIKRVETPGGPDRFDHNCSDHYHMSCVSCGKIFDVNIKKEPGMLENILDSDGLKILGYDIIFKGLCPRCQELVDGNAK